MCIELYTILWLKTRQPVPADGRRCEASNDGQQKEHHWIENLNGYTTAMAKLRQLPLMRRFTLMNMTKRMQASKQIKLNI